MNEEKKARVIYDEVNNSVDIELYSWDSTKEEYYWGMSKRYYLEVKKHTSVKSSLLNLVLELKNLQDLGYEINFMSFNINSTKLEEIENIIENDFNKEIEDGFRDNMFCDNTGFCGGSGCKNYQKCNG